MRERERSPALRLSLAVARLECDAHEAAEVRAAARAVVDWPEALTVAAQHRLTAFLALHLAAEAHDETPSEVLATVGESRLAFAAKALTDLAELGAVVEALATAGVSALPFKGQLLSWSAYTDLSLRHSLDLDVAIRPIDRGAALSALARRGYRHTDGFSPGVENALRHSHAQVTLLRLAGDLRWELDLHWRLAAPRLPWDPPFDAMLARTTATRIGGVLLPQLAPADELLLQLLHGARHHWASIESLVAVRELLRRHSIDMAGVLEAARAVGGTRAVVVGCVLAKRLVQASTPETVERAFAIDREAGMLVDDLEQRLVRSRGPLPRDNRLLFRTIDRPGDRARMLLVSAFYPTPREGEWLSLPDSLALLYWPLRLVRLAGLALARLFKR